MKSLLVLSLFLFSGAAAADYKGCLIDAMSQWDSEHYPLEKIVGKARSAGISRLAIFQRRPESDPAGARALLAAAEKDGFLIAGSPKYFYEPAKLTKERVDALLGELKEKPYRFVGELLCRHSEKTNALVPRKQPERFMDPGSKELIALVAGIKGRIPVIVHWEFYKFAEDFPRFGALFKRFPEQKFLLPHVGFGAPAQAEKVLKEFPNVSFTISKKLTGYGFFRDKKRNKILSTPMVGKDGALLPAWRALIERYPDRFLFATDAHLASRWEIYEKSVSDGRKALASLSPGAAESVACGNARTLYGIKGAP